MSIFQALGAGHSLVVQSRKVILWILVSSIGLSLVPTLIISQAIERSLGNSLAASDLKAGYSDRWFKEFQAEAKGIAESFDPTTVGVGAILNAIDQFLSGELFRLHLWIVFPGLLYCIFWIFISGGILVSFRERAVPAFSGLIAGSGEYFGRFVRVFGLFLLYYGFLYYSILPYLDLLISEVTREVTDERIMFAWTLGKYSVLLAILLSINLIADYTKILLVLEKRQSVLLALLRTLRLVSSNWKRVVGLYLLIGCIYVAVVLAYWLVAPGAGQQSVITILLALFIGQLYIISRIWLRMLFLGSQLELCRTLE